MPVHVCPHEGKLHFLPRAALNKGLVQGPTEKRLVLEPIPIEQERIDSDARSFVNLPPHEGGVGFVEKTPGRESLRLVIGIPDGAFFEELPFRPSSPHHSLVHRIDMIIRKVICSGLISFV